MRLITRVGAGSESSVMKFKLIHAGYKVDILYVLKWLRLQL